MLPDDYLGDLRQSHSIRSAQQTSATTQGSAPEDEKIVIIEADGVAAGLMVDGVNEVLSVEDDQVDRVATTREDVFPGIAKVADRLIVLIDPAGLLADLGVAALAEAV